MIGCVQVLFCKPVIFKIQGGKVFSSGPYRIGMGEKVSPFPVPVDQVQDLKLFVKSEGFRFGVTIISSGQVKTLEKVVPTGVH